jgi:hypothetical protein
MHPFLSLHTLASQRGDGLRPEFVAMYKRQATTQAPTAEDASNVCDINRASAGQLRPDGAPGSQTVATRDDAGR